MDRIAGGDDHEGRGHQHAGEQIEKRCRDTHAPSPLFRGAQAPVPNAPSGAVMRVAAPAPLKAVSMAAACSGRKRPQARR